MVSRSTGAATCIARFNKSLAMTSGSGNEDKYHSPSKESIKRKRTLLSILFRSFAFIPERAATRRICARC